MTVPNNHLFAENRRHFFARGAQAVGLAALSSLMSEASSAGAADSATGSGVAGFPKLPVQAKRVIYLFQSGAPSQLDLFDPKPVLKNLRGEALPDSIRQGQRLTGITSTLSHAAPGIHSFARDSKYSMVCSMRGLKAAFRPMLWK